MFPCVCVHIICIHLLPMGNKRNGYIVAVAGWSFRFTWVHFNRYSFDSQCSTTLCLSLFHFCHFVKCGIIFRAREKYCSLTIRVATSTRNIFLVSADTSGAF